MHWRSYRPSLLTTTAGSSVAYVYERQVVGMTGRVLSLSLSPYSPLLALGLALAG